MDDRPINTNALQERIDEVLARAAADPALRHRLQRDPASTLAEAGITLPPGASLLVRPADGGVPHVTVRLGDAR